MPWAQTEVTQLLTPQGVTPPPNTHVCTRTHMPSNMALPKACPFKNMTYNYKFKIYNMLL